MLDPDAAQQRMPDFMQDKMVFADVSIAPKAMWSVDEPDIMDPQAAVEYIEDMYETSAILIDWLVDVHFNLVSALVLLRRFCTLSKMAHCVEFSRIRTPRSGQPSLVSDCCRAGNLDRSGCSSALPAARWQGQAPGLVTIQLRVGKVRSLSLVTRHKVTHSHNFNFNFNLGPLLALYHMFAL
jgi:hypothetical protein